MRTARALILVPLFVAFEFVAFDLPPMTWLRWEIATPDTCCLTRSQIIGELILPSLVVLLIHGGALLILNELVRFAVLVGATVIRSPRALVDYYARSDYGSS